MSSETTDAPVKRPGRARVLLPITVLLAAALAVLAYCQTTKDPRTLRELIIQSRDAYHEPWSDVEDAAKALETPEAALAFVTDRIATSVYEGRLQPPVDVLENRTANPADKAMLLKALLAAQGTQTTALAAPLQGDARADVLAAARAAQIAMPEPMQALMARVGYEPEGLGADQFADALAQTVLLDDAAESIAAALDHADSMLDLDGPSALTAVYLDWVWLVAEDGTIYDPVLRAAPRSDLARPYDEAVQPTQFAVSARDRFGRSQEVVRWSGDAFGASADVALFPTIKMAERLTGDADMSDVQVWTPAIIVGDSVSTHAAVTNNGDVVPPQIVATLSSDGEDITGFTAPEISDLSIVAADATNFPQVTVRLSAAVQNLPNWHGAHFRLTVADQTRPVRIAEPFTTATNVIAVQDQTGSMLKDERFAMARAFSQGMVAGLSARQSLAVIAHNDRIRVNRLFDPINSVVEVNTPELWQLPVRGTTGFLDALDYALNAVEVELGEAPEQPTSVVLVTDGETSQTDLAALRQKMADQIARAQALNVSVYPVILSAAGPVDFAALADQTGGAFVRTQDPDRIASAAQALARRLAGGITISFDAPSDPMPAPGSSVGFSLEVAGYSGTESGTYIIPQDLRVTEPGLFVEISAGAHHAVRPLVRLGDGYDLNAMTGRHALYLSAGVYPGDRMVAQRLNQWLIAHDVALDDQIALRGHLKRPGIAANQASTMNGLGHLMRAALTDGQALQFPIAAVLHTKAVDEVGAAGTAGTAGAELQLASTIDVAGWSSFLSEPATRRDVARLGLALNDAEARMLGDGLNLTQVFAQTLPKAVQDGESVVLTAQTPDGHMWRHDPATGTLFGHLGGGALPVKGSQDVAIAAYFKNINTAIDRYMMVAQPGVGALPGRTLLSGFIGFKKEEMKLWCFATMMLNYVNESIEVQEDALLDQSAAAAEARAAKLCEINGDPRDIGERMFEAAAVEFAKAVYAEILPKIPGKEALSPPDIAGWISDKVGADNLTKWIGDPTTKQYAEQVTKAARDYLSERAQSLGKRGYDEVSKAVSRHGLGGGTGTSGGTPTTTGFNVAMQTAISGL